MDASQLSRQRLDHITRPDGSVDAVLTITLPGGVTKRFVANVTNDEAQQVSGEIIGAEVLCNPTVGAFSFKKLGRGLKNMAKKVASSKVFKLAAEGLAIASPLLGPLAPAALGAAAGLGVAAKLAKAGVAAAHGAHEVAKQLTDSAHADATRLTTTPAGAAALLQHANAKRLNAEKVADKGHDAPAPASKAPATARARPLVPPAAAKPSSSATLARAPAPASSDVLALANAGRVRSNDGTPVTPAQLLAAHSAGRIFWVHAA